MCGIVLVHNLGFNHYLLKLKKLCRVFFCQASASANNPDYTGLWIEVLGVSFFFILAGIALNVICNQLITKSNYYENQVIIK